MSRKSKRHSPRPNGPEFAAQARTQRSARARRNVVFAGLAVVLTGLATWAFMLNGSKTSDTPGTERGAALASENSPTLGDDGAKVHIVEFLDPACETCADFFPIGKHYLADNPGKIRLSVRHVAFHEGSDHAVRVLEASRKQDKYWQTLETLLSSQHSWAPNHVAQPALINQAIAGVGLDMERLLTDIDAPEVTQLMNKDMADAMALKVTATPEYFVNGQPMPSFGEQQLRTLIDDALKSAY